MLLCRMVLLKSGKGSCSFLLDACEARATLMSGKHGISPDGRVPRLLELDRWHPAQARPLRPAPTQLRARLHGSPRTIHPHRGRRYPSHNPSRPHPPPVRVHPPIFDGNGRSGRSLIVWQLCQEKLIRSPLLSLSTYFQQHQSTYSSLLFHVRQRGDWEAWLRSRLVSTFAQFISSSSPRGASELAISKWRRTGLAEVSATMPIAVISRAMIDLTQTEKARTEEMRHDGYSEASK